MHLRELGRLCLILGAFLIAVGTFFFCGGKLPFRLGHLPGDLHYKSENTSFHFPIVTCLVLSAALSFVLWLINHLRR